MALGASNKLDEQIQKAKIATNPDERVQIFTTEGEIPEDAIEVSVDKAFTFETPRGLPGNLVTLGDKEELEGTSVTVQDGVYIMAPRQLAESMFDPPMQRPKKGKWVVATAAALVSSLALAACGKSKFVKGSASDTAYDQMTKNLNLSTDLDHLGADTNAAFTQAGDEKPNGLEGNFGTETVITFIRDNAGQKSCYAARGIDVQDALTNSSTQLITLPGGLPNADILGCAVYDDGNGPKIYYKQGSLPIYEADLVDNAGTLTASNETFVLPGIPGGSDFSIVEFGGVGHILYSEGGVINDHNLDTGVQTASVMPDTCGVPHVDGTTGTFVGSRFDSYGGPITCRVVEANNTTDLIAGLAQLAASTDFVPGVADGTQGPDGHSTQPRLIGQYLVFQVEEDNGGVLDDPKIKYKAVVMYCGDNQCTTGEDHNNCPQDCPTTAVCGNGIQENGEACDDNNTVDGDGCSADCLSDETCGNGITDTAVGEVCDDSNTQSGDGCSADCLSDETCPNGTCDATETNATCPQDCPPPVDCGNGTCDATEDYNNCPDDCTGECGDGVCDPTESYATCTTDCDPEPVCGDNVCESPENYASCSEDCFLPACQVFEDDERITFISGRENCEMNTCSDTTLQEGFIVEGNCSFEVDFGGPNPVEFTIYGADGSPEGGIAVDMIEQAAHELLKGGVDVKDNNNHHGSTYRINGNTVELVVEGTDYISEVATMDGNDAYYAQCDEGSVKVYKNDELVATLTQDGTVLVDMSEENPDPDAGVDGGTDGGGTDADGGTDGGADAGPGNGDKPDCNCTTGKAPKGDLIIIGLMLLAAAGMMRRARRNSVMRESERVPGPILLGHVKDKLRRFFDRFRKAA